MANVIREDVVQLGFEVDGLKEIKKLQDDINQLKKILTGGLGEDEAFDGIKDGADDSVPAVKKVREQAEKLKSTLTDIGKKAAVVAFNGLKKVAGVSLKALAVGVSGLAVAVGKIGYEAIQSFADFEQLTGGVETLFKEHAGTVKKYANNAYKTAGLSANEYMETVTSFSASLISSCGGDTAKAAELANMAITDMSDNANKMGTDMGSIQYAYQGFSKQNYTMLDNLKLGYGGTKEEMQRLIKEASKMTDVQEELGITVDGSSMSYANIVKAIRVVQKNMGIMGTTQDEAEETITGSLNAMKSSWSNLLTAMGSGENIDQCIDNMVNAVEIFAGNVMPVAERALMGLGTVIEKLAPVIADRLPELADKLLPPLIKATISLAKGLIKSLPNIIKTVAVTIVDIFGEQFPIIKKIGDFFADNAKNMGNDLGKIIPIALALVGAFKGFKALKSITSLFGGIGGKGGKGGKNNFLVNIANQFAQVGKVKPGQLVKGIANVAIIAGGMTAMTGVLILISTLIAKTGADLGMAAKVIALIGLVGAIGIGLAMFAGKIGNIPVGTVAKGLANIAIVLVGFGALAAVFAWLSPFIASLSDMQSILKLVAIMGILGVLGLALTVFSAIAGLIPIPVVLLGLANMAIVLVGFGALAAVFAWAASFIDGLSDMKSIMKLVAIMGVLGLLGAALTIFAAIAGIIPIPVVLTGLANMALVLGGVTALIVAFGALSKIPGFNDFIETGGETLATIFGIIGKIGGSLIGGLGEGISNALPGIGKNLGDFGNKIKPLFSAMQGIDLGGVGAFFASLVALLGIATGNEIVEGIKSFFGGGESSLSKLGTQLTDFANNAKGFFSTVSNLPGKGFSNATLMFDCLAGVKSLPKEGGVVGWFSGNISYESLASGLGKLSGENVVKFFNTVATLKQAGFDNATKLFDCLAGLKSLPKNGGFAGWFSGSLDYSQIVTGLGQLSSEKAKRFFTMVAELPAKTFSNITALFNALGKIGELPKEGGLKQWFSGENDLGDIADDLKSFEEKTGGFFAQVNSVDISKMNGLWDSLKKSGSVTKSVSKIVDEKISEIVGKIKKLPSQMGDGLKSAGQSLADAFVEIWTDAIKASVAPVNKLLSGANHILKEFGSDKKVIEWQPYARGTNGHKGGNALVNDGIGAELVQMPNGDSFIPRGKNVFIPNAPKGMKVLPAGRTAQLMGRRTPTFNYANGIGNLDVWSYYDNAKGLVDKLSSGISYDGMSGLALSVGQSMVSTFAGEMPAWVDKLFEESGQSIASYVASKGVTQWLPTVVRALKMEGQYSAGNVARTLFQMKTESGGNPKAINLWDSNAKKGIPSKGLMQVIDPTFRAYARNGFDKNIYDPLSNILVSIRYAVSRYGSLSKAYRGVGYANGGIATKPSIFGEDGAEMAIPLSKNKRDRGLSLWAQTGEMFGMSSYSPESDGDSYTSNSVEYNTYSPQFSLTITGTNDDREMARKVKKWISEALDDAFDSMNSKTARLQEV